MTIDSSDLQPANPLVNFVDIIASPGKALRRISEYNRRSWWFPALLVFVATVLNIWLTIDLLVDAAKRQVEIQLSTMPPDQVEAARPMMERFMQPNSILITSIITITIGLILAWLISTLIIYLGSSIAGASPKLNSLWPVIVWAWIPFFFRSVLQTIWSLVSDSLVMNPGLAYFVSTGDITADQTNPLFVAASQVDLFSIWHAVLIYILLRASPAWA